MKKLLVAFLAIAVMACQNNETEISTFDREKDAKLISSLKKAYNLSSFDIEPTEIQASSIMSALKGTASLSQENFLKIEKSSIRLYENKSEGITIAIMQFGDSPDKLCSLKGTFSKGRFQIINEFFFARKMVDKDNGQIIITNNDDATFINVVGGVETYLRLNRKEADYRIFQTNDCQGRHGGTGFCQREQGESFSDCYKAEKDEFCDGFWSCIAIDTQPQVMLLVAGACSCSASQC